MYVLCTYLSKPLFISSRTLLRRHQSYTYHCIYIISIIIVCVRVSESEEKNYIIVNCYPLRETPF